MHCGKKTVRNAIVITEAADYILVTPTNEQQGDGVIRRRAAQWLLVSLAAGALFGCGANNEQLATSVSPASSVEVVAASPAVSDVIVTSAAQAVVAARVSLPAPTTTEAVTVPVAFVNADASVGVNEMQRVAVTTTVRPPASTVRVSSSTPPTTAAALETASVIPLNAAAAAEFQSRTNTLRASLGLSALSRNAQLDSYAASWVRELVSSGRLRHSTNPERAVGSGWAIAGENVGFGASVTSVQDALVASPGHYANLVGPRYTSVGVAAAIGDDGRLWVCEVFGG